MQEITNGDTSFSSKLQISDPKPEMENVPISANAISALPTMEEVSGYFIIRFCISNSCR